MWTWDVQSGRDMMNYNRLEQCPFSPAWSPDGRTMAAVGMIGKIYLWDARALAKPTVLRPVYE